MLARKRILLIIAGGIAAFKSLELIRHLRREGASVTPVLTCAGAEFVTPLSVSALAGEKLYQDFGCHQCHGFLGQGNQAAPAIPRIAPTSYPFSAFSTLVRTPPRIMPAYSPNILSDAQLRAIYNYMRAIPEPAEVVDVPLLQGLR